MSLVNRSEPETEGNALGLSHEDLQKTWSLLLERCSIPLPPDRKDVKSLVEIYDLSSHIMNATMPHETEQIASEQTELSTGVDASQNIPAASRHHTAKSSPDLDILKSRKTLYNLNDVLARKEKDIDWEALGLMLSMASMLVLSIVRKETFNTEKCAVLNASFVNHTCGNIVRPTCPSTSHFLSGTDDVFGIVGTVGLVFTIAFLMLLFWRNISITVLWRLCTNLHMAAVLILASMAVVFDAISSVNSWDALWSTWYIIAFIPLLAVDALKRIGRSHCLFFLFVVVATQLHNIFFYTAEDCCDHLLSKDWGIHLTMGSIMKSLHSNVLVAIFPSAVGLVLDLTSNRSRTKLYFVLVHAVRKTKSSTTLGTQLNNKLELKKSGDVALEVGVKESVVELANVHILETTQLHSEKPPPIEQNFDLEETINQLTLKGVPLPDMPKRNSLNFVNDSHGVLPHFENDSVARYHTKIFQLSKIYLHSDEETALAKEVTQSETRNGFSSPESSSEERSVLLLHGKIGVFMMWFCIFAQAALFFLPNNWEYPVPGPCDKYQSYQEARLWYGITVSLFTIMSWTGFALVSWRNTSKDALLQLVREPAVLMLLITLIVLFIVDTSKPMTNISGISSATYTGAVLMFVLSDLHVVRNRPLAVALGLTMILVTILNFISEAVCPVKSTVFDVHDGETFSLSKCDLRRSLYLSIFITTVDGVVTSISDRRNSRLWFVATRADRATGDTAESAGKRKKRFLRKKMKEGLEVLEREIITHDLH